MTTSQILLLLAGAVGLMWKVRNLFQENKAKARRRMEESAERRWGIGKSGLFDKPDDDEDDALWE